MRVLLYGFGPYGQFKGNITRQIVSKIPSSRNLKKIVFPVRFHKKQFTDVVNKHRPDFILGLGQCSSGKLPRIERRALNLRRNGKREKGRAIVPGGPETLASTLKLEELRLGKRTKTSRNAGDYVCNFSMYVILDYLRRRRWNARFGFVHVPHDYNAERAVKFVKRVLKNLT